MWGCAGGALQESPREGRLTDEPTPPREVEKSQSIAYFMHILSSRPILSSIFQNLPSDYTALTWIRSGSHPHSHTHISHRVRMTAACKRLFIHRRARQPHCVRRIRGAQPHSIPSHISSTEQRLDTPKICTGWTQPPDELRNGSTSKSMFRRFGGQHPVDSKSKLGRFTASALLFDDAFVSGGRQVQPLGVADLG